MEFLQLFELLFVVGCQDIALRLEEAKSTKSRRPLELWGIGGYIRGHYCQPGALLSKFRALSASSFAPSLL